MIIGFSGRDFRVERHPPSENRSLLAGSAADEYILRFLEESKTDRESPIIFHDRFGAVTVPLHGMSPTCVISQKSQEKSIINNLEVNHISSAAVQFIHPTEAPADNFDLALIRIPKSLELFRYYLQHLNAALNKEATVICSFMTRHFSPRLISITEAYFGTVRQSRAWKKSRLLILDKPKLINETSALLSIPLDDGAVLRQYPGVFAAGQIDTATRFLIDNLDIQDHDHRILDLGCGNGVIGTFLRHSAPEIELHSLDDSWLAVESAKLNLQHEDDYFHWSDTTESFESGYFDLIVSNPPFHFEHEIDISTPLRLFREARRILKTEGKLQIVANRHLNYRTHLDRLFSSVKIEAEDGNFQVIHCSV